MKLVHHPEWLDSLRPISPNEPLRILVSGCMAGWGCGVDGTDYGMGSALADFKALATTSFFPFCPEDIGLGTPRTMPDLHGGDGHAVLNGIARVLDENGSDLSEGMIRGANAMVTFAIQNKIEVCLLTDMSGACGTQVISDGCRFDKPRKYQQGQGVAAAALMQAGFMVLSNRDHRTLQRLRAVLEPGFEPDPGAQDHHETEWVRDYFNNMQWFPKLQKVLFHSNESRRSSFRNFKDDDLGYGDQRRHWADNVRAIGVEKVLSNVDRAPDDWISPVGRKFAEAIIRFSFEEIVGAP